MNRDRDVDTRQKVREGRFTNIWLERTLTRDGSKIDIARSQQLRGSKGRMITRGEGGGRAEVPFPSRAAIVTASLLLFSAERSIGSVLTRGSAQVTLMKLANRTIFRHRPRKERDIRDSFLKSPWYLSFFSLLRVDPLLSVAFPDTVTSRRAAQPA